MSGYLDRWLGLAAPPNGYQQSRATLEAERKTPASVLRDQARSARQTAEYHREEAERYQRRIPEALADAERCEAEAAAFDEAAALLEDSQQ